MKFEHIKKQKYEQSITFEHKIIQDEKYEHATVEHYVPGVIHKGNNENVNPLG